MPVCVVSADFANCFEDRSRAEDSDRNDPDSRIFVPECVHGGLYRKEQCHKHTGYCFCVDERTGVPIPGYSTHNQQPDCSQARAERVLDGKSGACSTVSQARARRVSQARARR